MTIVDIKALFTSNNSYPFNRKMAKALYCSMWMENWSSGAKSIIGACQEQGVEEPTWRWDGAFVYFTYKRPSYKPGEVPPPSSTQVIQLVQVMGDQIYSIRELTELCGYADPKHFR